MDFVNCPHWNAFEMKLDSLSSKLVEKTKPCYRRLPKPPYTYTGMIVTAIQTSETKKLTLPNIHEALREMFPFFRDARYKGWKDSVRHNLSHHCCFQMELKNPNRKNGKSNFWKVDMSKVNSDMFKRQETSVAREGNWAVDLHQQLGIPQLDCRDASNASSISLHQHLPQRPIQSRKRKFEEDTSMSSVTSVPPALKRHQTLYNSANLFCLPRPITDSTEDEKPLSEWTVPDVTQTSPFQGQQPSPSQSSDDSGCYSLGSSTNTVDTTSAYPRHLNLCLRDIQSPSFDGIPEFDSLPSSPDISFISPSPDSCSNTEAFTLELPACSMKSRPQALSDLTAKMALPEEVPSDYINFPFHEGLLLKEPYIPSVSGYCANFPVFYDV